MTSTIIGVLCIFLACTGLSQGIRRPAGSTGDLLDDLPFLAGQLFVPLLAATIGGFLLWRGWSRR